MRIFLLLLVSLKYISCSSILVDWSAHFLPNAQSYLLDYSPPVGTPAAGSTLPGNVRRILLNGTISATEYTVYLSAITQDGARKNVTELVYYSSPDPPILDTIDTTEHEATISYFPPQGQNITFHIEYYPEGHEEYSNAVETKASLVRLRGLESGTAFRMKIRSVYESIRSTEGIEASFKTQGDAVYDYSGSAESYTVRTLPADFDLGTTTPLTTQQTTTMATPKTETQAETTTEAQYSYEVSAEVTESPKTSSAVVLVTSAFRQLPTVETTSSSTATTLTTATTTVRDTTIITTASTTSATTKPTSPPTSEPITSAVATTTIESFKGPPEEIDTGDYENGEGSMLPTLEEMKPDYGEPGWIDLSEDENKIRIDWNVPEGTICDAFFLNYTILSLSRPRSFSIATTDDFTFLKNFPEHTLDLRVFCMLAGSLSKTWWAYRVASLAKPKPIENLHIAKAETDEFYVARITLDWNWPEEHDFRLYTPIVTYKTSRGPEQTIEVTEKGPVLIDKLDPSVLYHISVRNQSTELSLRSKYVEIDQVTPPLITSMLQPGQISSSAININFEESDTEQGKFDYYILTFNGNNKNITKKLEKNQEKSLTFTKLIPGKTYEFSLYTVYKGVRSRAVQELVTTYPLKVNQLFPVVGSDYVVLYWDIENFADSDCRFRVSYNADRIPPVTVEVKGSDRHKFGNLQPDTYYTFTILVIMGTGKAAAESESEMITAYIPKGKTAPTVKRQGSRELLVEFKNDQKVFSGLNGMIKNFAVIVSDNVKENDDIYELSSWFEVQERDVWGAYRASPSDYNPFAKVNHAEFIVGKDDCEKQDLNEPYCNGILRASAHYEVKIRAYTDSGIAMESDWAPVDGEAGDDEEEGEKAKPKYPCYMYMNGRCPTEKSSPRLSSATGLITLLFLSFFFLL